MQNMRHKKLAAMLLTLVMALSLLTVTAFADYDGSLKDRNDIVEEIHKQIHDPILADAVLEKIDDSWKDGDWQDTLIAIEEISLPYDSDTMDHRIEDLEGIQILKGLKKLDLSGHDLEDLAPLSDPGLRNSLEEIDLSGNSIQEAAPLNFISSLKKLDLSNNKIEDLGGISKLTGLTELNLSGNDIEDLGGLGNLTSITSLNISDNDIEDLGTLENLTAITSLDISNNKIEDLRPLSGLTSLTTLNVTGNLIRDFSALPESVTTVTGKDAQTETHTITVKITGTGTVSPATSNGKIVVADGGSKTVSFTPGTNYTLDKVLVDGAEVSVTENAYTFESVKADLTLEVIFKEVASEPKPEPKPEPEPEPEPEKPAYDKNEGKEFAKVEVGETDSSSHADDENKDNPSTGDSSNLAIAVAAMLISAGGAAVALLSKQKKA